jgi:hypothetical protein
LRGNIKGFPALAGKSYRLAGGRPCQRARYGFFDNGHVSKVIQIDVAQQTERLAPPFPAQSQGVSAPAPRVLMLFGATCLIAVFSNLLMS